jgi:hypothetical protein
VSNDRVQVSGVSVQVPNGRVLGSGFQDSETQALKHDTLYETSGNDECRLTNDGIASGFAFGYDPTGRSVFFK